MSLLLLFSTQPAAPELLDRLAFWHPRDDVALTPNDLDWGVVVRKSSADKQFRIRNLSPNYTAGDIVISLEEMGIFEPTREVAAQHFLSTDGRRFGDSVSIGALAPLAMSDPIVLRRVVAPDADLGQGDFQLLAHANEWL